MSAIETRGAWNGVGSHPDYLAHARPGYKPPDANVEARDDVRDPVVVLLERLVEQHVVILAYMDKQHDQIMAALGPIATAAAYAASKSPAPVAPPAPVPPKT